MSTFLKTMSEDVLIKTLRRDTITLLDSQMKWPYMAEALARLLERTKSEPSSEIPPK